MQKIEVRLLLKELLLKNFFCNRINEDYYLGRIGENEFNFNHCYIIVLVIISCFILEKL